MTIKSKYVQWLYAIAIFTCFLPFVSPATALIAGILFSILGIKHKNISSYTHFTLQASIVLMGFGMNLSQVLEASGKGFLETAISVVLVMSVGLLLGMVFKVERNTTLLISAGTAICGGSAIAAVAPILNAKNSQISFSLIVVFVLNAFALVIFPVIGHRLQLSETTFGNWAAIAIHDTSSVVGAGATYGPKALEVATSVKLIRALWIIPLSVVVALMNKEKSGKKIKVPWFIFLFAIAIVIAHFLPNYSNTFVHFNWLGKRGMMVALFFIGSNLSVTEIKNAGTKSFMLGIVLWLITAGVSLMLITQNIS